MNYRLYYKPYHNAIHALSPGVYTCEKMTKLSTIDKIHFKCDPFDGSVVNGLREPFLPSFVLDKRRGYKVFCEAETRQCEKRKKCVLNSETFYLEDDNHKEVNFNGKTVTFSLQSLKM